MSKNFLLLTTIILSSSLYSDTTGTITWRNEKVYPNAKFFYKDKDLIAEFECGKTIVFKRSETQAEIKPLTRWKTQEECNQAEENARQDAEKRKEEEATITGTITLKNGKVYPNAKIFYKDKDVIAEFECGRRIVFKRSESQAEIKPLARWKTQEECNQSEEEQHRQELALKKQECEAKGNIWNGKDCRKKSVMPVIPNEKEITDSGKWSGYQGEMNWYEARAKCESIGMRLPTIKELKSAYKDNITKSWEKINTDYYWSSSSTSGDLGVYFGIISGDSVVSERSNESRVRCFQSKETNATIDSGTWSDYQGRMNWEDAKKKCENIKMRLPTIEELKLAYAEKIAEPWRKDGYYYWSSTPNGDSHAYLLDVIDGVNYNYPRSSIDGVRCIR